MDELTSEKILAILQDCYHRDITPDEGLEQIDELLTLPDTPDIMELGKN